MTAHPTARLQSDVAEGASYFVYRTPLGRVTIGADSTAVTRLAFGVAKLPGVETPTALTNKAANQVQEYLAGKRMAFDVPVRLEGSPFQLQVWDAIARIPYGSTASYGEVAAAIGNPRSLRAVGSASKRNPVPLIVPCHRVVGADGSLVGYAYGLPLKRLLLDLEAGRDTL